MATIAVGEIVQAVVNGWDLLGGAVGLSLPLQQTGLWHMVFNRSKLPYHYIALGLLLFTLLVNWLVTRSHVGYYLRAIKDEPDAARSLGVSLTRYKLYAIALSSGLAAMGGTLYAQKELLIDPGSTLSTGLSIKMSLVAILGGVGTLTGPVVGAVVLTAIEEASRTWLRRHRARHRHGGLRPAHRAHRRLPAGRHPGLDPPALPGPSPAPAAPLPERSR